MDLSNDFITFSFILESNDFKEIKGSTTNTTYFRNTHGNVLSVNRVKDYDDNYLSELADQATYDMDEFIRIFKLIKTITDKK